MQYIISNDNVDVSYLAYALEHMNLSKYYTGAAIPHIYFKDYKNEVLPDTPLEIQREIAYNLDKAAETVDICRKILEKFDFFIKAKFAEMFGDINEAAPLSDIASYFNGLTYKPENVKAEGTVVLRSGNIQNSELEYQDLVRVDCQVKDKLFPPKEKVSEFADFLNNTDLAKSAAKKALERAETLKSALMQKYFG